MNYSQLSYEKLQKMQNDEENQTKTPTVIRKCINNKEDILLLLSKFTIKENKKDDLIQSLPITDFE